eukprot:6479887-Amphidinium_carterae.1
MLTYVAKQSGIIKTTTELATFAAQLQHSVDTAASAAGTDATRQMKDSGREEVKFQQRLKGNLHVALCVAIAPVNKAIARMLLVLVRPVRLTHGMCVQDHGNRDRSRARQVSMSSGGWLGELLDIAGSLKNQEQ